MQVPYYKTKQENETYYTSVSISRAENPASLQADVCVWNGRSPFTAHTVPNICLYMRKSRHIFLGNIQENSQVFFW